MQIRYFFLGLLIFLITSTNMLWGQRVPHNHYVTFYNLSLMEPDSVVWDLTPDMIDCNSIERNDRFRPDPDIPGCATSKDFKQGDCDRGHLFPYAEAACDPIDAIECYYMSNMLPQYYTLNRGDWKTLEEYERDLASLESIHIIAGGAGSVGLTSGGVNIPEFCWKAIYACKRWVCWIIPNDYGSKGHDAAYWKVSVARLNELTGLRLR